MARLLFFFFNDTATTEIYTLSLHDALPISAPEAGTASTRTASACRPARRRAPTCRPTGGRRSEEHTSELQSRLHLVCRLLLEKKKKKRRPQTQRAASKDSRGSRQSLRARTG